MIAVPLQILVTTVVAARLLVRSFETRQRPELLLGLFYLCSGSLGFGLLLISALFATTDPDLAPTISRISVVSNVIGIGTLMLFVHMSFRPDSTWLRWVIGLAALALT